MTTEWRNGAPYNPHNVFTGAALTDRAPERKPVKKAPSPTIKLPGSMAFDSNGRQVVPLAPKTNGMSVSRATPSPFRRAA